MTLLPYRPHVLLRSGHLQTLMVGLICGNRPAYAARKRIVPLLDGEALVVHEEGLTPQPAEAPLSILVHGLGGDHTSPYLQRIAHQLHLAGQRVWRVDLRGSGAGLKLAWRPPHAGRSEDLACVIHHAAQSFPQAPILLTGFSLSGNIVLRMLGQAAVNQLRPEIDLDRIKLALAVAPPVDLAKCADNIDRPSRTIYTRYYLKTLAQQVALRRATWPQWEQLAADPPVKTIRQFDARYTAPLSGFRNTDQYYASAAAKPWLASIGTPTRILVDRSDPIVTARAFDAIELSAMTELIYTRHGGHMGYFGVDADGRLMRWMEHFVQHSHIHWQQHLQRMLA